MPAAPKPAVAPRKRPSQARAAATVAAILEAAARILEERGLEGFNTNAVAERAGVSVGSLYQYFPGKDAIAAALVARELDGAAGRLEAAVAASERLGLDAAVRRLARVAVDHQLARPALARILDSEERRLPVQAATRLGSERVLAALEAFVRERGRLRRGADARTVAGDLLAAARGITDAAAAEEGGTRSAALEARVARALRGYLLESLARPQAGTSRAARTDRGRAAPSGEGPPRSEVDGRKRPD